MKLIKLFFCFIVSGLCLLLIFRKVDIHEVPRLLSNINYLWFFIATIIGIFKMWITGFRLRYLMLSNRLSSTHSFYFYAIGTMANMLLPFRVGDIIRARMISETLKVPNTKVLGTIASEHILDFIMLCCLLICCLALYSYTWPTQVIPTMISFFIIAVSVFGITFVLKKNSTIISKIKNYSHQYLPKRLLFLPNMFANFYSGFFQLGSFVNLLKIFGVTCLIWISQGLWIYTLLCSLGIADIYQLGSTAVIVLMVMMGIAIMIPSSPGYIGTFHLMVILGLTQMGAPKSVSLSYAILAHAHAIAVAILLGLFSLWRRNIKLSFNFNLANKSDIA